VQDLDGTFVKNPKLETLIIKRTSSYKCERITKVIFLCDLKNAYFHTSEITFFAFPLFLERILSKP
ncbi:hypothetical protein, partial [Xanthomarina sp.]|uniref:hypothetical protein n=1 Tax=Xanthomarina sp. TaxID=1931211 RepID=UPI002C0219D0